MHGPLNFGPLRSHLRSMDMHISGFSDAGYAGDMGDRKSTSGFCTFVGRNLETWRSKKQDVVSQSSAEVEYRTISHTVCEMLWLQKLMTELGFIQSGPMPMYCDNQSAIYIAKNHVFHERTKHIEVDCNLVRDAWEKKVIVFALPAGYLHMIRQMKELIEGAGKKSYTLVMGRPNSAKLANFPECDVFVYVSCAQTALLDSKDFLAPVITPFEAVLAFSRGKQWTGEYVMEFRDLINSATTKAANGSEEARFSFLQGGYMEDFQPQGNGRKEKESSLELVEATETALVLKAESVDSILFKGTARSGAEFFAARSYQGLNMEYENPSPQSYIIGRAGKASGYEHEMKKQDVD